MKKLDRINELVDELNELKPGCMAASLDALYHSETFDELDAVSLLEQVIGPEYQNKTSQRFQNRLKRAHLSGGPQSLDKCKDSVERVYLPSDINATLSSLDFIREGLNVCILGPSDSGKSYLAKALGIQACLNYRAMYHHCEEFLEAMVALKQADYSKYQKKIRFYLKLDLPILDDFLLHTITDEREIKVLFEVMEKRSELSRCTIVCSQREPNSWASMILNDEVSANAILKRGNETLYRSDPAQKLTDYNRRFRASALKRIRVRWAPQNAFQRHYQKYRQDVEKDREYISQKRISELQK